MNAALAATSEDGNHPFSFSAVYGAYFREVSRWARALGCPEADLEDVAQEVFLVVRRKLDGFDGGNLPGWLYAITYRTVSDHRRRAWFRRMFRRPMPMDDVREDRADPAQAAEDAESRRLLRRLLGQLGDKHRAVFTLFELEGYSGEEIAALVGIPVATVWTRLHHARKQLSALAEQHRQAEARPFLLRPAVAALLLLLLGSLAVAAILLGHRRPAAPRPGPAAKAPAASLQQAPQPAVSPPAAAPVPAPAATPAPRHRRKQSLVAAPEASSHEAALVLSAVKALRRDRDPQRAGVLLEDYLRHYPEGVLLEEAMALSVEAAAARGDPAAAALASEYLKRFPGGRFRDIVRAAQRRSGGEGHP